MLRLNAGGGGWWMNQCGTFLERYWQVKTTSRRWSCPLLIPYGRLGSNPGLRIERAETNGVRHATASCLVTAAWHQILTCSLITIHLPRHSTLRKLLISKGTVKVIQDWNRDVSLWCYVPRKPVVSPLKYCFDEFLSAVACGWLGCQRSWSRNSINCIICLLYPFTVVPACAGCGSGGIQLQSGKEMPAVAHFLGTFASDVLFC